MMGCIYGTMAAFKFPGGIKLDVVDQGSSLRWQHCCSLGAKWENRWSPKLQRCVTKQFLCDSPRLYSSLKC